MPAEGQRFLVPCGPSADLVLMLTASLGSTLGPPTFGSWTQSPPADPWTSSASTDMWEDAASIKGVHMIVIAALPFFWWLIFFFLWVIFLALTMSIARSKGHSPLLWGLLACFLPLITVIILLLLPARSQA